MAPFPEPIREATTGDVDGVLALWRSDGVPVSRTDDETSLGILMGHPTSTLLVAEESGVIVGTVIAAWDGWRGELYRLAVAQRHRRMGLGTRLVRAAEGAIRERGARRINALVLDDATEVKAFWRSVGYERDDRIGRFVQCDRG